MSVTESFGRSENLPILQLARDVGPDADRAAAGAAGFSIPQGVEPAYALAIGMAESSPRVTLATIAAISRGVAGQPAVAPLPRIVASYESGGQWRTTASADTTDLRAWFHDEKGIDFLRAATSAAIRYKGGTLRGAIGDVPPQAGEVGKSGTDARENLDTWGKFSTGALNGGSWVTMVVAPSGPIGDRTVSTIGLSRIVRASGFRSAQRYMSPTRLVAP